ncbi:hypothetical protein GCM10027159_21800 [Lysobacter terrae]
MRFAEAFAVVGIQTRGGDAAFRTDDPESDQVPTRRHPQWGTARSQVELRVQSFGRVRDASIGRMGCDLMEWDQIDPARCHLLLQNKTPDTPRPGVLQRQTYRDGFPYKM